MVLVVLLLISRSIHADWLHTFWVKVLKAKCEAEVYLELASAGASGNLSGVELQVCLVAFQQAPL